MYLTENQYNLFLNNFANEIEKFHINEDETYILRKYGIYNIFYEPLNEDFHLSQENKEDLKELQRILGKIGKVCARLIVRLLKWGAKEAVKKCVAAAKAAYKAGKEHPKISLSLFFSLLFYCIGFGTHDAIINKYNENPVVAETRIDSFKVQGKDTLVVYYKNNEKVLMIQDGKTAPVIKAQDIKTIAAEDDESPIRLLRPGEKKITNFKPCEQLINGMLEVEHFVDHIYDAKHPDKPVDINELRKGQCNGKYDWTMLYGHHLSEQECKTLDPKRKYSKAYGKQVFMKDLQAHVNTCNNKLKQLPYYDKVQFSNNFFYGLLDLEFNCGPGQLYGNATRDPSTLWQRMNNIRLTNNGKYIKNDVDYALACINDLLCGRADQKGLKYRRRQEYLLMNSDDKNTDPERFHMVAPQYRDQEA